MSRYRSRIHAGYSGNAVALQVVINRAGTAPVARKSCRLPDDQAGNPGLTTLVVLFIDAIVADEGICHTYDLPPETGIGAGFLVAGHGCSEYHFAGGFCIRSKSDSPEDGAISQGQSGIPFWLVLITRHDAVPLHLQLSAWRVLVAFVP